MAKVLLVGMHNADNQYVKMLEKYDLEWEQASDRGGRFSTECDAALIVTSQVNLVLQQEVMEAYKSKKIFYTSGGVSAIKQKLEDWINAGMKKADVESLGGVSNFTFYALATTFAHREFTSRNIVDYVEENSRNEINQHSVIAKVHEAKTRGFIQEVGKSGQGFNYKLTGFPLSLVTRLEAYGFPIPNGSILGGRNPEEEVTVPEIQETLYLEEIPDVVTIRVEPITQETLEVESITGGTMDSEQAQVIYLKLEDIQASINSLAKQPDNIEAIRQAVRTEMHGMLNVEESLHVISDAFPGMTKAMAQKMIKLYRAATEE